MSFEGTYQMKKTISQLWEHYKKIGMRPEISPIQISICQTTFYAGVAAIVREMAEPDVSENKGVQTIQKYIDELKTFADSLKP